MEQRVAKVEAREVDRDQKLTAIYAFITQQNSNPIRTLPNPHTESPKASRRARPANCKGTLNSTSQLRISDHLRKPFKFHRHYYLHQLFPHLFQFLFPQTFPTLPHFWLMTGLPIDYLIPVSHPLICIINYFILSNHFFIILFTPVNSVYSIYTPPPHLAGLILFS